MTAQRFDVTAAPKGPRVICHYCGAEAGTQPFAGFLVVHQHPRPDGEWCTDGSRREIQVAQ